MSRSREQSESLYPMYEVLTANGITEVVEHRRMEPVFYITDDPEVRRKLGVPELSSELSTTAPRGRRRRRHNNAAGQLLTTTNAKQRSNMPRRILMHQYPPWRIVHLRRSAHEHAGCDALSRARPRL